jgi:hypothetical protein
MLTATKPLPIQLNWEFASHTSLHVDYTYARPRQDRASLVCNGSENTDEIGLRNSAREKSNATRLALKTHVVMLRLNVADLIAPPFPNTPPKFGAAPMAILRSQNRTKNA